MARPETRVHQVAQINLGAALQDALGDVFGAVVNPTNPDATAARWMAAATDLTDRARAKSTALAADYLTDIGPADLGVKEADEVDRVRIAKNQAFTGVYALKKAVREGVPVDEAMRTANAFSAGRMQKLALEGGRETIRLTVNSLTYTAGWRRIIDGDACEFCVTLAGRGAVYRDAKAAGAIFKFHNNCGCTVEPFFFEDRVSGRAPRVRRPRRNAPTAR